MLEVEFAKAMDSLLPLLPDQLCRRLFMQSLSQLQEKEGQSHRETVPTKRLACIQQMYHQATKLPRLCSYTFEADSYPGPSIVHEVL